MNRSINLYKALFAALLLATSLAAFSASAHASDGEPVWMPSAPDAYFRLCMYQAKYSEGRYYAIAATDKSPVDMESSLDAAIESWAILWRVYGYAPAAEKIRELSALNGGANRHAGFTQDFSIEADATVMELKNPDYKNYTMFLLRIVNRHYDALALNGTEVLVLDTGGKWWRAEKLSESHPLWENVKRLASTFAPLDTGLPARVVSFKQVYATPNLTKGKIRLILLKAGEVEVEIPYLESISSSKDLAVPAG